VSGDRVRCEGCAPLWKREEAARITSAGPTALAQLRGAGLDPAHGPEVEAERRATPRAHRVADAAWERRYGASGAPIRWERLRPRLADVPVTRLREVTGY
jgi:hypothetical protein